MGMCRVKAVAVMANSMRSRAMRVAAFVYPPTIPAQTNLWTNGSRFLQPLYRKYFLFTAGCRTCSGAVRRYCSHSIEMKKQIPRYYRFGEEEFEKRYYASCGDEKSRDHLVRCKMNVSYDGAGHHGFQYQENSRTVQFELEKALSRRLQLPTIVTGASRTDTGVHARGQVVHFDLPVGKESDLKRLEFILNRMLPDGIRVYCLEYAPGPNEEGRPWCAINCATAKLYRYYISTGPWMPPMERLYRHHLWHDYDMQVLKEALSCFVGEKDFRAFANGTVKGGSVRTIYGIHLIEEESKTNVSDNAYDGSVKKFYIEVILNGALYKMIRNIVGTTLLVANGRIGLESIDKLLQGKGGVRGAPTAAPAHGLVLEHVYYDESFREHLLENMSPYKIQARDEWKAL